MEKIDSKDKKSLEAGGQEGYKAKKYCSFPVLMLLLIFCFPISLLLSLLRLRGFKEQSKGYQIRGVLALGINVVLILSLIHSEVSAGKWLKDYGQCMESGDYSQAKEILDGHYGDSVTKEGVDRYIEVFNATDEYSDLGRVVLSYYDSLEDKTEFDQEIIGTVDELRNKLNPEQRGQIDGIWKNIEEARAKKLEEESKAIAENESRENDKKESESGQTEQQTETETGQTESTKDREQELAEQRKKDEEEIRGFIAAYVENPRNKYIKELGKKESSIAWEILKNEYIKPAVASQAKSDITTYCEMYQKAFPESNHEVDDIAKNIQNINDLETKVRNIKGKYKYDLQTGIESIRTYEWYVQNRLETQYEDTVSGAIMKEIDSYQKGNDSEWVAYNVEYVWGTAIPGDNAVVLHSDELNPFSQSGAYTLDCILSSEKRTLVNSSGFQWEAEVYEIISEPAALTRDYNQILESENQIEMFWDKMDSMLELLPGQDLPEETVANTEAGTGDSEKAYAIPLDSIFPSDWTKVVSWHSESTGYYMIPEMFNETEPVIYFSTENNTITASIVYGVLIDSVKQNEYGGVVCTGKMYSYTRDFGSGGEEELNGTVEVTWSSLESIDFPGIKMIDGHQMTDVSMIANDYSYYGFIE